MGNQRRRGKSVVFDSLPSLVTTEDDSFSIRRNSEKFSDKMSREAVREIVMVLVGLALVVWLFFGHTEGPGDSISIRTGTRQILRSDSPFIVPAHLGTINGNSRDGVKKAPGDKQGMKSLETTSAKKTSGALYQYDGSDAPKLVVVTVIDDNKHPREYIEKVVENRLEFAQRHHYGLLIKYASDFSKFVEDSYNHQVSWSRVALAAEAQISFPGAEWFWYLADDAIIMQPEIDVLNDVLHPNLLEQRLLRQIPVMRYSNTHIKTYRNNRINDINYVFCQGLKGISSKSFFFRNSVASQIWLQLWSEPLYRTFQRFDDEEDALGHLMQWHTQFLVRTGVIEPHFMGSLVITDGLEEEVKNQLAYESGDFVAIIACDYATENCKREFLKKWNERVRSSPSAANPGRPGAAGAKDSVQNQVQVQAQEKAQEKAEKQIAEQAAANV